jgi:hypothetical protein
MKAEQTITQATMARRCTVPDQSFVEHEVANIVASWAMEGQHCTAEEIALLHDVAAGRVSGNIADIVRLLDAD